MPYEGSSPLLTDAERDRLVKLARLFSSDLIGERAAAAAMAHRVVQRAGLDWDTIIRRAAMPDAPEPPAPPDPDPNRHRCAERERIRQRDWAASLTDVEIDVLLAYAQTNAPSDRQRTAAAAILQKIRDRCR